MVDNNFKFAKTDSNKTMKEYIIDECDLFLQEKLNHSKFVINYVTIYSDYSQGSFVEGVDNTIKVLCVYVADLNYYIGLKDKFSIKYFSKELNQENTILIEFYEISNYVRSIQNNIDLSLSTVSNNDDIIFIDILGFQLRYLHMILFESKRYIKTLLSKTLELLKESEEKIKSNKDVSELSTNVKNIICKSITHALIVGDFVTNDTIKLPINDSNLIYGIKTNNMSIDELKAGIKHLINNIEQEKILHTQDELLDNLEMSLDSRLVSLLQSYIFSDNQASMIDH